LHATAAAFILGWQQELELMYRILFLIALWGVVIGCSTGTKQATTGEDWQASAAGRFVPYDVPAEMIEFHTWKYPKWAKNRKVEGEVWAEVLVDTTGKVRHVELTKADVPQHLVKDVRRAARYCKFKPALRKERPVACTFRYKVVFILEKPWITWEPMTAEEAKQKD
jgi:TonB family protein